MNHKGTALVTDLYQLTMAQGYWENGKENEQACFHMYFRENPFKGGFAIACGMAQLAEIIEEFHFSSSDIEYLSSLEAPGGGRLFKEEFLKYLLNFELRVDVDAVREGTVVFPNEPLVRVVGPIMHCQLLETALLNCVNFETLIATKAARVCHVAQLPVMEFGLRRAQGAGGGMWASRSAVVGGCASTSNVLAGKLYNIPVSGTHAHSWVMAFDDEIEAFRAYARAMPKNCVLLVDTYDALQGVKNAITVGIEMRDCGEKLAGIRIDSGDLAWLSKMARAMLDDAGLKECGIVLSNDLDEYTIQSLRDQGACATSYGVGTKLATAYDQPTLGGIYKLSALKPEGSEVWQDCLKVSEQASKMTVPGILDTRRYYHENGLIAGDMVFDTVAGVDKRERIIDPESELRQKSLFGKRWETLLQPLAREGVTQLPEEFCDALVARSYAASQIETLDETQKRMLNPHSYPVGLECGLFERRRNLVVKLRAFQ
ncbi:MAG: nicotinate phosphoribosyltransferase [Raoultibacter sp.]